MLSAASSYLGPWSNFYVLTGSAAAALTGLMFVVISLVSAAQRGRSRDGISTFSTPTVVHLGAALLVSAIMSAPWHVLLQPAILLGIEGLAGVIYVTRIMHRAKGFSEYEPDSEDWMWYSILPILAYAALLVGAVALPLAPVTALFGIGAGTVTLIFTGIHNSWDVVTFLTIGDGAD